MHQPQPRASRLRVVTLASTVALAVALPLAAAVAGEDARLASEASEAARTGLGGGERGERPSDPQRDTERGSGHAGGTERGPSSDGHPENGGHTENGAARDEGKSPSGLDVPEPAGRADGRGSRPASSCGPEIASPEGVEAQTCVLTEDEDTWARTYYRNATNGQLPAVLTLMRPDGRTVQVHCTMPAADEPGICETPRHSGGGADDTAEKGPYSAVAEVASADGERRLLRSGSNSPKQPGS
ncbi:MULTISPECIES: hypothetical protein [unclassified Streptomyces]|uniref:hypothetical protein n=1 Tax=unclassified Streptomyces TaxID=2593676 RepID=UPI002DDA5363|nr:MULTISPECIES: hypothetical protein [unclassified Streptomyces]WSA93727.1 hypothetical protein OIE63_20650 [Streptomyces sp. NBC_01795]WSB78099.1 hypothetical protein OHB04_21490 [Streptomyces sp. NBC_01775]WSS42444.1 hypothetical protein OG220_19105 [Streptomyces sp. NBC_01187]